MPNELTSWPRPHFTPGGGDALLFYVAFGTFDLKTPLSRSKYRASGMPDWLELLHYNREQHADVIAGYQTGKRWEILKRDSPLTVEEAETAPQCVALRAEIADPSTLDYFRDTIGIVAWLLDAGGLSVYDPQVVWLWSAVEWREEAFAPGEPHPERHTAIQVEPEAGGTNWYRTLGMRKYGRPDLSVHGVGAKCGAAVSWMIEQFIELQALGGDIPDGQEIVLKDLPPGGVCRHGGSHDDPRFNNVHVSIEWPTGALK